jgi:hypothetical protein
MTALAEYRFQIENGLQVKVADWSSFPLDLFSATVEALEDTLDDPDIALPLVLCGFAPAATVALLASEYVLRDEQPFGTNQSVTIRLLGPNDQVLFYLNLDVDVLEDPQGRGEIVEYSQADISVGMDADKFTALARGETFPEFEERFPTASQQQEIWDIMSNSDKDDILRATMLTMAFVAQQMQAP